MCPRVQLNLNKFVLILINILSMKQNKPLILRVSNQPFPSASPELSQNIQNAIRTKKFIYMDMACK